MVAPVIHYAESTKNRPRRPRRSTTNPTSGARREADETALAALVREKTRSGGCGMRRSPAPPAFDSVDLVHRFITLLKGIGPTVDIAAAQLWPSAGIIRRKVAQVKRMKAARAEYAFTGTRERQHTGSTGWRVRSDDQAELLTASTAFLKECDLADQQLLHLPEGFSTAEAARAQADPDVLRARLSRLRKS
jgi:hypothetical protein